MKNNKPSMQIQELQGDIGNTQGSRIRGLSYLSGLRAKQIRNSRTPTDESILVFGYAPPNDNNASGIGRYQHIGKQMLHTDLRKMLIDKYGDPIVEFPPNTTGRNGYYTMSWSLKPDGEPQTSKTIVDTCGGAGGLKGLETLGRASLSNSENRQYNQCGFTFVVKMLTGHTGLKEHYLINSYSVIMYDFNEITRKNKKTIDYSITEAKKVEVEHIRKASSTNKPQL
jgi:hypothetical protein